LVSGRKPDGLPDFRTTLVSVFWRELHLAKLVPRTQRRR
jgi:hypothetical protein